MPDKNSLSGVEGRIKASEEITGLSIGEINRDNGEITFGAVRVPFSDDMQAAKVQYDDLCTGLCITGATGMGKTTVATNMLTQLAIDGRGFVYMDAKGSGTVDLLRSLPESRLDDVRIIGKHPNEYDTIRGFDVRETPKNEHISPLLVQALFTEISGKNLDVDVVNSIHAAFTIANELDKDISDIRSVLAMDRDDLTEHDIEIDEYRQRYVLEQSATDDEIAAAFGNEPLSNNPLLNDVFNRDGHSIYNAIINGEIIILCVESFTREIQQIIGTALFGKLTESLIEGRLNPDQFYPIVVDNFDVFDPPAELVGKYAAESRKYRSPLITLLQSPDRFSPDVRNHLYTNTDSWICFRSTSRQSENELKPYVNFDSYNGLLDLNPYVSIVRLPEKYGTYTGVMYTFGKPTFKRSVRDTEGL